MQTAMTTTDATRGNAHDTNYDALRVRLHDRFTRNTNDGKEPVFTTDAELWEPYLASFPDVGRQFHNCNSCRRFIERFGALVTIGSDGITRPVMWDLDDVDVEHQAAYANMIRLLRRAKVTGVFLSSEDVWGTPVTGVWTHFAVVPSAMMRYRRQLLNAGQAMAEKAEDFKNVQRALDEFTSETMATAVRLLESEALYRNEKVLGPAKWLAELHAAVKAGNRANKVWRAIATAPAGFCHPRSSMIGTLLEDIAAGMTFEQVSRRFGEKMNPTKYQRPQAAPKAGNVAQAEKVVAELGATGALGRRFARLDEIETIWRPAAPSKPAAPVGVFGHLKTREDEDALHTPSMRIPAQTMTFEKFRRVALDGIGTVKLELLVPSHGPFMALTTAEHLDAPPILQWDSIERRNPFSWYVYAQGSHASHWGLSPVWTTVTAVSLLPPMWHGGSFAHHGEGAIFILDGARDAEKPSICLFPEQLRSEFHGVRATIEAYSRSRKLSGYENASACGFDFRKGFTRSPGSFPPAARLRATDRSGSTSEYELDRWD